MSDETAIQAVPEVLERRPRGNPAWRKGVSGNAEGRPKAIVSQALRYELEDPKRLMCFVRALLEKAYKGDLVAIKEVLDRVEGKAQQSVEVSGMSELIVKVMRVADE